MEKIVFDFLADPSPPLSVCRQIALKAIFKKDAGGFNKPAPVAEAVKLTKLPDDVKRDYDAAAVKWIVKSCMPHSITERDQYLREFLKVQAHSRFLCLSVAQPPPIYLLTLMLFFHTVAYTWTILRAHGIHG